MSFKLLRVLITGVGGQGVLSVAKVLGLAASKAGYKVLSSAVHGMAQRGGVVETYVTIGDRHSPVIDPGEADVILGLEPVETLRSLPRGSANAIVISNNQLIVPFYCSLTGVKYPDADYLFGYIKKKISKLIVVNANKLAENAGSILSMNMVMLGVMAGTSILPFEPEFINQVLEERTQSRFKEINLKTFREGMDFMKNYNQGVISPKLAKQE